jgi:ribosomal protein S14
MTNKKYYGTRFIKTENKSRLLKFYKIYFLNNFPLKHVLYTKLNKLKFKNKNNSKTLIKSACLLTGRNKSINQKYLLSRIKMREFILLGMIPGCRKAVW